VRGFKIGNGVGFGLLSTCNTRAPSNQHIRAVPQVPKESTAAMANGSAAAEIDELAQPTLQSILPISLSDVYDMSTFDPVLAQ
jgi:hypothetical protein